MLTLVGGCLAVASNTFCGAETQEVLLVGESCTAETISSPMRWLTQNSIAIPTQKFLFFLPTLFFFVSALVFTRAIHRTGGFTWFNGRLNFTRGGPILQNLFLPYLFATHGW